MTTAEAAEARFRWLCRVAERLGCKLYVGDYGTSQGWDGKTGLTRSGERVVAVNMGARVSFAAASIHEQVGAEARQKRQEKRLDEITEWTRPKPAEPEKRRRWWPWNR